MVSTRSAGYRELSHTADWALEVWAPDVSGLFVQAARGMLQLMGVKANASIQVHRSLHLSALDHESLLVAFLGELLFIQETQLLAFTDYNLKIHRTHLKAELTGAPIMAIDKEIKAVTFHNLAIQKDDQGLRTTLVFDV